MIVFGKWRNSYSHLLLTIFIFSTTNSKFPVAQHCCHTKRIPLWTWNVHHSDMGRKLSLDMLYTPQNPERPWDERRSDTVCVNVEWAARFKKLNFCFFWAHIQCSSLGERNMCSKQMNGAVENWPTLFKNLYAHCISTDSDAPTYVSISTDFKSGTAELQ